MGFWGVCKGPGGRRRPRAFRSSKEASASGVERERGAGMEVQREGGPGQEDRRGHCRVLAFMVGEMGGAGGF